MSTFNIVQARKTRLELPITASDTTIRLSGFYDLYGNALTMADFGDIGYGTIEPGSGDSQEIISFSGITNNGDGTFDLTGVVRGLKGKYPYSTGGTPSAHGNNVIFVISNNPQVYQRFLNLDNGGTVDGQTYFTKNPQKTTSALASNNNDFITKNDLLAATLGTLITDQLVIVGTAGETVAAGDLVYLKESDQRWWKADADLVATIENVRFGFAEGASTAGAAVNVLTSGIEKNLTGLTAGSKYYISNTSGAISVTPGTLQRYVGVALSTTRFLFSPEGLSGEMLVDTAGEILAVGDWVYFKASDQKWWKTDADATATAIGIKIGVAQTVATANGVVVIRVKGINRTATGLTAGAKYYLSGTAGAISTTPGATLNFVGWALSTNELLMADENIFAVTQDGNPIYAVDSAGTDDYVGTLPVIPAGSYIGGTTVRIRMGTGNTGPATLNINGIGAKAIVKNFNQPLVTGDIVAGQIVELIYDTTGDNFQMLSPVASVNFTYGTASKAAGDASTTQTIAHGLGRIPRKIRITAQAGVGGAASADVNSFIARTLYNGTTQTSVSTYGTAGTPPVNTTASFILNAGVSNGTQTGVVTFDATNITITWTQAGATSGQYTMLWEAE